jgi:hypothetical protein
MPATTKLTKKELVELIGDPAKATRSLDQFDRDAVALSRKYPSLLRLYARQWIAFYKGRVRARADSLEALMDKVDGLGLPRGEIHVRYMSTEEPILVL